MSQSPRAQQRQRPRWVQDYLSEEFPPVQPARTGWFIAAALLVAFGTMAFFLILNGVLEQRGLALLDEPVRAWMVEHRTEGWTAAMILIAEISGPIGMPIVVAVFIVLWIWRSKHAWRVLVLSVAMLTGMSLALLIARLVGRERPPQEFMLIGVDPSFSFPSGHVLGVADFLIVGGYLVLSRGRGWVVSLLLLLVLAAIVGVGLVALTRVYLGYHWVTDVAASLSLSLCVLGLAIALDTWRPLRHPPEASSADSLSSGANRV